MFVREAPAVAVNTNEIIPQREPETLPVGISVHVILICSNPFRDNPKTQRLSSPQPLPALLTVCVFPDVGHPGGVCEGARLHLPEDGRHHHHSFPTASHRPLQRGSRD